jgi:copper chaperone CopZ
MEKLTKLAPQHDDHFDYLVHNKTTGELHLEHPCNDCGDSDYHGKFRLVGKRKWNSGSNVQLHFFEASQRTFDFRHLFEPESSRVSTLRHGMPKRKNVTKAKPPCCSQGTFNAKETEVKEKPSCCSKEICTAEANKAESNCCSSGTCGKKTEVAPKTSFCASKTSTSVSCDESDSCCADHACSKSTPKQRSQSSCCPTDGCSDVPDMELVIGDGTGNIVRSTFVCRRICCSSEVPMIDKVLKHVVGIDKVMVNVPLKNVIVDHDSNTISAKDIRNILDENHFGASIQRDGGHFDKRSTKRRSRFHVENICCASEIPAIRSIVDPLDGVSNVMINVTTKTVSVFGTAVVGWVCIRRSHLTDSRPAGLC